MATHPDQGSTVAVWDPGPHVITDWVFYYLLSRVSEGSFMTNLQENLRQTH